MQKKNKKESRFELNTDTTTTSSATTTEQLNSRSSISTCKLINSIQEKRKKLQAQQSFNSVHKKRSSDNIVCDAKTLCAISAKESSESDKEQINVSDDEIECKDMTSSTRDGCCCKDTSVSSEDLEQKLSDSPVPCSDFSICDNFRRQQSWTAIYPSGVKSTNDSDASLSNAICTNVKRENNRKSAARNNVCKNNNEYITCHAVDGSRWLPKSIYTDCATNGNVSKERFAETKIYDCKYRNKRLQDSVLNDNNVLKRQIEHKLSQGPSKSCQKDHATRQRSRCSCITEEEEDCFTIDKIEEKFPENIYNNTKCFEKISVCRTPDKLAETATVCDTSFNTNRECIEQTRDISEDSECLKGKCNNDINMSVCQTSCKLDKGATICETVSFSVARDRFEKMQTCKSTFENSVKRLKGVPMYETAFGNSEELPKLTRVCKKFVTEEYPKDITVCKRMFGEPKRSSEEVIVCEALPDAEETPKKTICKKISDSNFVNQNNNKNVFLSDTKDNLVKENTNGVDLNIQKTNKGNATTIVQLDNGVALSNLAKQKPVIQFNKNLYDTKQDGQNEKVKKTLSNNVLKILTTLVGPNKDSFSKSLSKILYSTASPQFYDCSNLVSNPNETWKILVNK